MNIGEETTDDSDFDAQPPNQVTNKYGQVKTSRYNRPKRDFSVLAEREKLPSRSSARIAAIKKNKGSKDKVIFFLKFGTKYSGE